LPELYCGFSRNESVAADAPVQYPVSCRPQAWAAGAIPLLMRALLGLEADPRRGVVRVAPFLPDWLPGVCIDNMQALGTHFDLEVERDGSDYRISSDGPVEIATPADSLTA
jgi:glycogen debranching enzyme